MSLTRKMFTPNAIPTAGQVNFPDGTQATIATDGSIDVPNQWVPRLLAAGYVDSRFADRVLTNPALAIGTTVTFSYGAFEFQIGAAAGGGNTLKHKALSAGLAFGALGTIPASVWGVIGIYINASGTISFASAPLNYTTGYTTEALAIAALPATPVNTACVGYITVLASSSMWVAGTDALASGSGGNPATTTNYYNAPVIF